MTKINEKELKELFNDLKNNKEEAFENLYKKYNRLVYGIAFSIIKNSVDSEDIVQIVFTKIYELNKEKFPTQKGANWLYTLTKNETISFLRKKNNVIELENIYEIEDDNNELNDIVDIDEFNKLLSKLNVKEKQIVTLKILGDFSFNEISKLLNESTGTVKWRYYKALNTIKILLSNLGMFIVTFVIGLRALIKSVPRQSANIIEQEESETTETLRNNIQQDTTSSEVNEIKSENTNDITYENVIIQDDVIVNASSSFSTNYLGLGCLGISGIFLIVTIIFTIIFLKHQLKGNKKSSK